MEVLKVPEAKEELVTLALEDVLMANGNAVDYSTKYFRDRASLLVCFARQQDKEKLRRVVKNLKVDDVIYDVQWTKMENFPSGDHECLANLVEVLDVSDEDLVCSHFENLLGKPPQYHFEKEQSKLILYLESDEELSRLLQVERPIVTDHGPVRVMPVVELSFSGGESSLILKQGKKYCLEVLGAIDEDFVIEYIESVIKRRPNYQYFAESSRIVLTLESQAECDQLLSKNEHYIKGLEGVVSFRQLSSSSKGLKVSGIPETVSEKFLNAYFQNEKNGGGAIKTLKWDAPNRVATIFYADDEVAERVFKKPLHQIRSAVLTLQLIEDTIANAKAKTFGVKVTGIHKEVSEKYLTSYFSKDINGGGTIRKLDWDRASGTATIFFCDNNVAETVASKSHTFRCIESVVQLIEEEESNARDGTKGPHGFDADARDRLPELTSSSLPKVDSQKATAAALSSASAAADREVSCCLVVVTDTANVGQIESHIRKTWQIHDGDYELQFNPSECVGIVRLTTMTGKLEQVLAKPQQTSIVFEKCHGETESVLGNVHILIEQISAETSREAVWSWLMVVTRCAAHQIFYSDVLPGNCRKAVALISFHEGLRLESSLEEASNNKFSVDNHTLHAKIIRSPLKLMYVGRSKKVSRDIKQELQKLLDNDGSDADRVEDVDFVGEHAIVTLSSHKAFRMLLMHTSRLDCSIVLPYYDQLGCISATHIVDYRSLATKIKGDLSSSDIKRFVCPRLVVTVIGGRLKEDILRKFFADRLVSGGDKSATLRSNSDGSFVVTFDNAQAADRIYQKYQNEGLKLGSCSLSVFIRGMRETSNSSANHILVRNIGLASEDSIKFVLWALADTNVTRLTFVRDPQDRSLCALAQFQKSIDIHRLAYYCEAATLDCNQLDIEPVPQPTALILRNVPANADKQIVKYCFETDHVTDCVEQSNGTWIVYFTSPECASVALGCELFYDTTKLSVEPFSEYRVEKNAREKGKRGSYQIHCTGASLPIANFMKECKQCDFDNLVKETGAVCEFAEDGYLLVRLPGSVPADHVRFLEEKFQSIVSDFEFWQVDVLPDLWNDLLSSSELVEIRRLEKSALNVEALDVDQSKSVRSIALTGLRSAVQNARQKVEQAIRIISHERERQKQRTSHTEILSPWTAKLLVANDVCKKLQDKCSDLVVKIDKACGTCYLEGFPADIKSSLDHLSNMAASIVRESLDVSVHASRFLERETVVSYINAKLLQENLMPDTLWFLPRGCVVEVCGLQAEHVRKTVQLIRAEIFENDIVLGETMDSVVSNEKWKDCTDAICGRRNGDVIISEDIGAGILHVICKASDSAAVLEEINNFTRRNLIKTTFMELPRIVMQLLISTFNSNIQELERRQSRNHVRLSQRVPDSGACGFQIEGNADGIINMQRLIADFLYKQQKVVTKQHIVRQPGAESFFNNRPSALRNIGLQSQTYVEVHDPNSVVETIKQKADGSCEFLLPNGVVISVAKASITDVECDVVVNPSNGDLQHTGGVAKHIAKLGGIDLVTECDEYVRKNGKLPEGQACITSAGRGQLRCKKVIHAVGPRWQGGNRSEVNKLFQAVQNSLFHAEHHQLTSVALPPISSGIFGYPLDKCTGTIVESVLSYCDQKKGSLSKVILVDVNDEGVMHFKHALNRQLGKENEPEQLKESRPRSSNREIPATARSKLPHPDSDSQVSHGSAVAFQDVSVEVLREDICSQQADVIVSTIGQDLQLSKGFLSQSILKAAGNDMEQELQRKYSPPMLKGDVAITDGYRLKCRKVYHVCCPAFDHSQEGTQIQDIALKMLKKVNEQKLSSIVFPAIGTGNLGHPVDSVAKQLYRAVQMFGESTRTPVLTKVKFVLPNDELLQAFQACHRTFLSGKMRPQLSAATGREAAFSYEELHSKTSTDKLTETVPAVQAEDHKKFMVNGISIEVLQGDITDEKTTIIVNCSDNQLSLDGQVSSAICRKGGPRIAEECKKRKSTETVRTTGVFLQNAGNLGCHYVLHVDAHMSPHDIATKCLQHAEEQEAESIAFPKIGTGPNRSNAISIAPALIQSILTFINGGQAQSIKCIRFVILDEQFVQEFQSVLERSLSPKKQSFFSAIGSKFKSFWQGESASTSVSSDLRKNRTEIVSLDDVENMEDIEDADCEVILTVCGNETNTDTAIRLIEQLCADELGVRQISEEPDFIAQLSDHEVQKYIKFGGLLGVSVDVQRAQKIIILKSMDDAALSKANENIVTSLLARKVSFLGKKVSDLDENYSQMLEEQCSKLAQWQYKSASSTKWNNYPKVLNRKLEGNHTNKQPILKYGPPTNRFAVDLVKNVDSSESNLDEDATVRRRDPNKPLPEEWDSTHEEYAEIVLDINSSEFKEVEKEFKSTLGVRRTTILQITRVQNTTMYLQYIHQRERIASTMIPSSTNPIERRLWHGTIEASAKFICRSGFNRSCSGKNNTLYGEGVYFAKNSELAAHDMYSQPNATKEKYVILALVLTGDYELGTKGTRVPAKKPGMPLCSYDTTVDNYDNPTIFVTYNDCQAYPFYVIKFT